MSDTNGAQEQQKAAKVRRKPKHESILHPMFAATRYGTSSTWWDKQQQGSGLLQRQCACGTHIIGGGECDACRRKHEAESWQPTAVNTVFDKVEGQTAGKVQTLPESEITHDLSRVPAHTVMPQTSMSAQNHTLPKTGFAYDFSRVPVHTSEHSTMLRVGAPADKYEQEASRMAEAVVRNPASTARDTACGKRPNDLDEYGGKQSGPMIQRELATPPPATAPPAQADLTEAEITKAIAFNKHRYTTTRIKLIQDLVGTEPTGEWVKKDIIAIAQIQEEYGLQKDGMVGAKTFQFIDKETSAEKLSRKDENCLVALWANSRSPSITPLTNGADIQGDFSMHAMLPSHCNCSDYEYRQFIRGHFRHERAGVVTDEADWFGRIPGGRLPAAFIEDGDTSAATVNYGHRAQPREDANPKNRYENFDGTPNQANGCVYEGEDFPGGNYRGHNVTPTTGDTLDLLIQFRGEIQRRGRTVETEHWTALQSRFVLP